jgi:hypothetical protein
MKPLIGSTDHIGELVREHRINEVLVSSRDLSREEIGSMVIAARRWGAEVKVVSEVTDMLIRGSQMDDIAGVPVVVFPPTSLTGTRLFTKRLSDYGLALAGLICLVLLTPVVVLAQLVTYRNYSYLSLAFSDITSVLAGRYSLVGPACRVEGEKLRPGVTGIWRTTTDAAGETQRSRMDMYYIQNWSLSMDLEIVLASLNKFRRLFGSERTGGGYAG